LFLKNLLEDPTGRGIRLGYLFGRPLGNDIAAQVAAFRPKVDYMVCGLNDVHIMLDDQDRVAGRGETVQNIQ
jgi:hypothetical protein